MAVGSQRSSEESDLLSQKAPYEDDLDYFKSSKGVKPFGGDDLMHMMLSRMKADGGKRTKGKRDADSSELSDDDDGGFGTGYGGGFGGNQLAPLIGRGMYDDDFEQEAPNLLQQKRNETKNPPVVESLGSAPAKKSAQQGLLIDEMPKVQAPSAGKGGILEDLENAPKSKKAPAKLKRGFGDHLKSLGKGLKSFGAWAISGFGLGGLIGAAYSNSRSNRNNTKAQRIEDRMAARPKGQPMDSAEYEQHLKQSSKMGKYRMKADRHELKAASRRQFASGYQWRKRLGQWALTGNEKTEIHDMASSEGNSLWRDPYSDSEENMQKPMATWRDARDVLQGRNADPLPETANEGADAGADEELLQAEQERPEQVEDPDSDPDDNAAWLRYMKMQAKMAERQREAEEEKLQSMVAEQSRGPKTAAHARMMSKRMSQARATQRLSARQTSRQLMFSQLGSTQAQLPQAKEQTSQISPIIEEEEKEED